MDNNTFLKILQMMPGYVFLLISTSHTFWANRILMLRMLINCISWDSIFPGFQISRFPYSHNSGRSGLKALGDRSCVTGEPLCRVTLTDFLSRL